MPVSSFFSNNYAEARDKFRDAAAAGGAALATYLNPAPAPDGLELTTDTARLGPRNAKRILIAMSGTHGVEGFCGSAIQIGMLRTGLFAECPADTALLLIHAINPSGFAWIRRETEDNVDLNRNFVDHRLPYPANPGYELLRDAICLSDYSVEACAGADAVLDAYHAAHGAMALQAAISVGQFVDPEGLFYGGREPTWSNRTLREILKREARGAKYVGFIDLHCGLGPFGVGEINNNHPPGTPGYRRVRDWYGSEATSSEEGSSASAEVVGEVNNAIEEVLAPAAVTGITLEFGTVPPRELLDALRADNWLYRRGRRGSAQAPAIKAKLRRVFYPETDEWRNKVWERASGVIRRAMTGLSKSGFSRNPEARIEERGLSMATHSASRRGSVERAFRQFMRQYDAAWHTQETLITGILRRNAGTVFGKEHGFAKIRTAADYQRQVPIRSWAEISPYVDAVVEGRWDTLTREAPFFFQRTTGTTDKPKMIPFTRRCQALSSLTHRMWIYKNLLDNPDLLKGRVMALLNAGIDGYTARGDAYGATSGNIYFRMPPIIRRAYCHLYDIFQIPDVDARRYTLLRFAVEQNCSFVFTGNPSSLLAVFEFADRHSARLIRDIHDGTLASEFAVPDHLRVFALNELRPNPRRARILAKALESTGKLRPVDYWPDLQSLACWIGGSMGHFSPMLREWCGPHFRFRDVGYMASEGVFSIPLGDNSPDGVLALHAIFFEFVPEREFGRADAPVLLAHEIEPGRNYHVVITTTGGLYRYAINDVIRVTDTHAGSPTIRFLYKGGNVQNLQGELMTVDHVMSAISALTGEFGIKFRHFQVVADLNERRYFLHIEPAGDLPPAMLQQLLASFERELGKANENYAQFRTDRLMKAAGLRLMKQGWFDRLSQAHIARTGRESQFKPPVFGSTVAYPEMVETSIELD